MQTKYDIYQKKRKLLNKLKPTHLRRFLFGGPLGPYFELLRSVVIKKSLFV